MKKQNLLLAFALMASSVAFAQTNLAEGKTASASTGNVALAVDGSLDGGSRWESAQVTKQQVDEKGNPVWVKAGEEDPWKDEEGNKLDAENGNKIPVMVADEEARNNQWWQVDLGESQEFDMIQIVWEGAYGKKFKIYASTDNEFSEEEVIYTENGLNPGAFPYTQTIKLDKAVSAQYVKFQGIERGTQWGYSFYEFRVMKDEARVLNSITLSAADNTSICKVGIPVNLTCAGKDQFNDAIATGDVTYTVTPAEAGSVVEGAYKPTTAGIATIVASVGEIKSEPITIIAYDGDKVTIDATTMVTGEGDTNDKGLWANAFDADPNSQWQLCGDGNHGANLAYNAGFTVDLQGNNNVTGIYVSFERASSKKYTITLLDENNAQVGEAISYADEVADEFLKHDEFYPVDSKNVRYVKFMSTEAHSVWGVGIYDFSIYAKTAETVSVNIDEYKYITFSNEKAVKFDENVTVYIASEGVDAEGNPVINLTKVEDGIVPPNTGVILYSATSGIYNATVTTTELTELPGSGLLVSNGEATGDNLYILGIDEESTSVSFYKLAPTTKVAKGKCYIALKSSNALKKVMIGGGDGTTGISNINAAEKADGVAYNLNGVRVNDNYKGIVIINGKKVIRK